MDGHAHRRRRLGGATGLGPFVRGDRRRPFPLERLFCYRMVRGEGPNVAADSSSVPAYAQAPIGRDIPIAAYIGYPLLADGQLFGTLCAIDPQVRPDRSDDEPLIRLLARLLSTVLESQLHATNSRRWLRNSWTAHIATH